MVWRDVDRVRRSRDFLQAVGLDEQVDDEGAAGLALTVQAVAAVDDHRFRRQPVPNRAARAAALTWNAHATAAYDAAVAALAAWRQKRYSCGPAATVPDNTRCGVEAL